ncbi:helix-turn-helix domain-containing protein [Methylobacterium sp. WL19]|uniref:helix-turn-helix transcriptional regulator n=1 Tax=Methylobacterium sp. WL19 TaxID=2603896 RepID=UPI0011C94E54|nr:helix-turn-helix domain-containing protein [Methylobacterium sp. WL19]TXN33930.1 helix-turn-helix domain-containing protein [Methylobacterium sp. WL19]
MQAIAHIRKHVLQISQARLAEVAKVAQATVSRWEAGEFDPGLAEITRIRTWALAEGKAWDDASLFLNHKSEEVA